MIPYGRHNIDQSDINSVVDVLKGNWLTCGSIVDAFEDELGKKVNSKFAVACSNGTTALHLALLALGIGKGDVVLVPSITFLASANAIRYVNAEVVFVDVDSETGLMNANTLEQAIIANQSKNFKAIINVHFAGQCEDLEKIAAIAQKHNLKIIEDAAHAIGTVYTDSSNNKHSIGSNAFSDLTTFSFHPVKTIAMGEGGAVTTNDPVIAEKLKIYRSHGMIRNSNQWQKQNDIGSWYYEMQELGYNYRVSDINCALGLNQLKKLEEFKSQRTQLVEKYDNAFSALKVNPIKKLSYSHTAWHLYVVRINFKELGIVRKDFMEFLKRKGIGSQVHYIPVHQQPYYKNLYGLINLPGSESYYEQCLSLPLYVGLTSEEQKKVISTIGKLC